MLIRCCYLIIVVLSLNATAAELEWNGFLSVGGGVLSDEEPTYLDFDDDFSFNSDSVFALQVKNQINSKWSATAQFISRGIHDFDTQMEWAFLTYEGSDRSTIRAGLLRAPIFNYSDVIEVGYSYHWIRPPREVYGRIPYTNFNGIDYIYNTHFGSWSASFQAYFGRKDGSLDTRAIVGELDDTSTRNWGGGIATINNDWLTLRASLHRASLTTDLSGTVIQPLIDALNDPSLDLIPIPGLGQSFRNIADDLVVDNTEIRFSQIGFEVNLNYFIFAGEYVELNAKESFFASEDNSYLMAGYRYNDYLWHVTYAKHASNREDFTSGLNSFGIPELEILLSSLNIVENIAVDDENSLTIGVRYEISPKMACKLEWQNLRNKRFNLGTNNYEWLENSLLSFSVDIVF